MAPNLMFNLFNLYYYSMQLQNYVEVYRDKIEMPQLNMPQLNMPEYITKIK
jgi:hypothetical protein